MIIVEHYIKNALAERQKHLNLEEPCVDRGGYSTKLQGLLSLYLNTTIPKNIVKFFYVMLVVIINVETLNIYIGVHIKKMFMILLIMVHLNLDGKI